jgi:hypothetical protein
MSSLLKTFLQIALRQRGPDALPASHFLLVAVVIAYLLSGIVLLMMSDLGWEQRIGLLIMSPLFLAGFCLIVLRLEGKQARAVQALTALFAISVLFTIFNALVQLGLPSLLLANEAATTAVGSEPVSLALSIIRFLFLALLIWNIAALAWIFQRAMDKDAIYGTGIAVIYYFVDVMMSQALVS